MRKLCAIFLFAALATDAQAAGEYDHLECSYSLKDAPADAPKFSSFPARMERLEKRPLDFRNNPRARRYRTVLRDAADSDPNFAGHYHLVNWGCGSSCSDVALINDATGKVYFDRRLESISGVRVDDYRLQFRLDSNLLIVLGGPHEDEEHGGIFYYRWDGNTFRLLRFVPGNSICKQRR